MSAAIIWASASGTVVKGTQFMKKCHLFAMAIAIGAGLWFPLAVPGFNHAAAAAEPPTSFKEDVFPVFQGRCVSCHSPSGEGFQASGLDLTSYKGVLAGTSSGRW
jgi:hypothetical protein